jgi:hypothetical protein
MRWRGFAIAALAGLVGLGLSAAPALGSFHLIKVREVAPGTDTSNDAFVELQMYAAGQNLVGGHLLNVYGPSGAPTTFTVSANVTEGGNQRTVLIGDSAVAGADQSADLGPAIDSAGGAVCWEQLDCVAWGALTNAPTLATGTPAPAVPAGRSLTRSIAPGCPTLLEGTDDANDSATDFAFTTPTPRPNATPPTEVACGGAGSDSQPPQTKITKGPKAKTSKTKAKFKFRSSEPDSSFECKLDRGPFKRCDSPEKVKHLDLGRHKFRVRAVDAAGNADPSPAKLRWKVLD